MMMTMTIMMMVMMIPPTQYNNKRLFVISVHIINYDFITLLSYFLPPYSYVSLAFLHEFVASKFDFFFCKKIFVSGFSKVSFFFARS